MADDEALEEEETVGRLIAEVRQGHLVLEEIRRELYTYTDLGKLSMRGAVAYLIRHKRMLDEVKLLLKRATRKPESAMDVLHKIESLIEKAD